MLKEMVMLVRRVNCFEVVRIKKVQFFAKKEDRRTFFKIERIVNLFWL